MDKESLILGQELGQAVCKALDLDPEKIISITIRMQPDTAAAVEVVHIVSQAEGEKIAGALEVYGLTQRGV